MEDNDTFNYDSQSISKNFFPNLVELNYLDKFDLESGINYYSSFLIRYFVWTTIQKMKNNKIIFTKWDPKGSRHRYFFQIFYRKYSWASRTLQLSGSLGILSDVSQVTKLKPSFEKRRENRSYL